MTIMGGVPKARCLRTHHSHRTNPPIFDGGGMMGCLRPSHHSPHPPIFDRWGGGIDGGGVRWGGERPGAVGVGAGGGGGWRYWGGGNGWEGVRGCLDVGGGSRVGVLPAS